MTVYVRVSDHQSEKQEEEWVASYRTDMLSHCLTPLNRFSTLAEVFVTLYGMDSWCSFLS